VDAEEVVPGGRVGHDGGPRRRVAAACGEGHGAEGKGRWFGFSYCRGLARIGFGGKKGAQCGAEETREGRDLIRRRSDRADDAAFGFVGGISVGDVAEVKRRVRCSVLLCVPNSCSLVHFSNGASQVL
jgi:hypothetical protein